MTEEENQIEPIGIEEENFAAKKNAVVTIVNFFIS